MQIKDWYWNPTFSYNDKTIEEKVAMGGNIRIELYCMVHNPTLPYKNVLGKSYPYFRNANKRRCYM